MQRVSPPRRVGTERVRGESDSVVWGRRMLRVGVVRMERRRKG